MSTDPRFPFADFEAHLSPESAATLAQRLGVSTRTVWRWRADGLTAIHADRVACACGLHPGIVWADWWATAA
jgi:hypothetical protein